MREIEFRGKRVDNGEWVYGSLIRSDEWYGEIREKPKYYICPFTTTFEHDRCYKDSDEVSTETVGQYTGLVDKNGTKIFEGDIVRTQEYRTRPHSTNAKKKRFLGVVEYFEHQHHNSIAIYDNGYKVKTFEDTGEYKCFDWSYFYDCEVVGNIYDNPELVNGE